MAHRAVDGIMGPREMKVTHEGAPEVDGAAGAGGASMAAGPLPAAPAIECSRYEHDLHKCLGDNTSNIAFCQPYVDTLSSCQRGELMRD